MSELRIALLGGAPAVLGGGGLERQMQMTAEALRRRGHSVEFARAMGADDSFDLLHAIGNGTDVWQNLEHWRRNRTPLVTSPVIVSSPGAIETKLWVGSKLGFIPNVNSMTRDILRQSDYVIALTAYERKMVHKLAGKQVPVEVIDNGVDAIAPSADSPVQSERPYVVMLGSISARKRQTDVLRAAGDKFRFVVVGGFEGSASELAEWEAAVVATGTEWLGEIKDRSEVARVLSDASALVLLSRAEVQSLAVLEALAYGTPAVVSELPSHKELAKRWPQWVLPVEGPESVGPALDKLMVTEDRGPAPAVPTWDDVAKKIEHVYRLVLPSTSS